MSDTAMTGRSARINPAKAQAMLGTWVSELLLACLSLALLIVVAQPLADGDRPLGLDARYALSGAAAQAEATGKASTSIVPAISFNTAPLAAAFGLAPIESTKFQRAQWLNRHAGTTLALLTLFGLITLSIGRGIANASVKLPLVAAFWCGAAYLLGAYGARWPEAWRVGSMGAWLDAGNMWAVAASALLLASLWNCLYSSRMAQPHVQFRHGAASPWVYPGFVLFSGLGWLWLLDLAARGHLDKQFVGIYQADSLWLAYAVFTLVAAHQGQLLAAMSRLASRLDRIGATRAYVPNVLLLALLLVWIALLVAAGHIDVTSAGRLKSYQRHAALLSELMRVPVWLALGWILYRWVEMGQRTARAMPALAALLAVLVAGLHFDHDGGPILAQTIAVVWISSGLLQALLARRFSGFLSWAAATACAIGGTVASIWLAFQNAPQARVDAMALDYQGPLNFLSVMHWLLDAAPAFGFGIGKTPWCGYEHVAGLSTQCRRAGVPDQIQSDYVVSAMLALWGWLPTVLLLAAMLLWLWDLLRKGPAVQTAALDPSLLRQWIVMGFAVTSGVQIAISVAGTLGRIPLTGLAIPMLSLGGAGLLSTAVFAGLSANRMHFRIGSAAAKKAAPAARKQLHVLA
jgi:cell division protein FtsW (lipid II flippase)